MECACQPKLYIEDAHHNMSSKSMTDQEYANALEVFVVVCVDVVLVNRARKTVYLARRKAKPMQGWWVIGGRIRAGEIEHNAMHRKFLQETSVDVEPARFEFLRMNRYFWKDREQDPQNKGTDALAYTFAVELTDEELRTVSENLEKYEYEAGSGLREFTRYELLQEGAHEAVIDMYDQAFKNI